MLKYNPSINTGRLKIIVSDGLLLTNIILIQENGRIIKETLLNAQDIYGMTPLHYAMRAENGDAAMVLLEAGADPNIETYADQGIPLAMIGGIPDRLDVLKAMLDKGADVYHPVKNANMSLLDFMKTYFSDDQSLKPIIALMEQYA
ncbi:hypothetical protein HMPREF3107_10690 [Neisseria sp. HMSC31F04]|uniref:ankyrin repeat domain-containing protein n=1 Tax=Neisseria sp. HMSC31F04 TaxID=1581075 RepID=UPI0008A5A988|nr:ankyrin repeat domain-containing protein [Neisseria sp. HMSC31F04]OFS98350.1 hypothetical protein HMPREF3107_10690 [Neisseria sp. HMSC31F04]